MKMVQGALKKYPSHSKCEGAEHCFLKEWVWVWSELRKKNDPYSKNFSQEQSFLVKSSPHKIFLQIRV